MYVNCSLYLLQLSSAQKWKNLHLKQCCRSVMLTSKELPFLLKQILKMEFKSILLYIVSPCRKDGIADINPHRPADKNNNKKTNINRHGVRRLGRAEHTNAHKRHRSGHALTTVSMAHASVWQKEIDAASQSI